MKNLNPFSTKLNIDQRNVEKLLISNEDSAQTSVSNSHIFLYNNWILEHTLNTYVAVFFIIRASLEADIRAHWF